MVWTIGIRVHYFNTNFNTAPEEQDRPNFLLVMKVNLHEGVIVQSRNKSLGGTMNSEKNSIALGRRVPNMASVSLRGILQS